MPRGKHTLSPRKMKRIWAGAHRMEEARLEKRKLMKKREADRNGNARRTA